MARSGTPGSQGSHPGRRSHSGIGRVLETLQTCGLDENTIVFFSSDNGPYLGGEGEDSQNRFNCGFNGMKGTVYEGGIRVPLVLRWPADGMNGGREISEMAHFCDWFPTILAMTGTELPEGNLPLDGVVSPVKS